MPEPIENQYYLIGHIGTPHGVEGTVLVIPEVAAPKLFDEIELVHLQNARGDLVPARIESVRIQQKNERLSFFVKFEHITDRNQAESVKNYSVYIDKNKVQHLVETNSQKSWLSFKVFDQNNSQVGIVKDTIKNPAHLVLVVSTDADELLIPFVGEYIHSTDEENEIIYCKNLDQLNELTDDAN